MYKPLVSIIIPVYNGSNYIRESIKSALAQTYDNIEILVINDGSTDQGKTEEVVRGFGDQVRYLPKKNGGVSSALNYGIEKSQGEWISWLSHDDLYYEDKIHNQIEVLNKILLNDSREINNFVLFGPSEPIDRDGKRIPKLNYRNQSNLDSLNLILKNVKKNEFSGCTFLIPRKAFDEIGLFNESYLFIQDKDYWYRLLFSGFTFEYSPEVLVKSRIHHEQGSNRMPEIGLRESKLFYKWVIDSIDKIDEYKSFRTYFTLGCFIRRRGEKEIAEYAFDKAKNFSNIKLFFRIRYSSALLYYDFLNKTKSIISILYRKVYKLRP